MLITIIFTLTGIALGLWHENPLLLGAMGFLLGRVLSLDLSQRELQRRIASLLDASADRRASDQGMAGATPRVGAAPPMERPRDQAGTNARTSEQDSEPLSLDLDWEMEPQEARPRRANSRLDDSGAGPALGRDSPAATNRNAETAPGQDWSTTMRDWLQRGNLFVRVGILLVFFGVSFLIKYAVDQAWLVFTLELRLAAVAAAGAALLGLGWFLRRRRRDYGLLLQGAAIGILYLDVYGAYQLGHLLSAIPAFLLLALIGLSAAALAVFQNAPSLAWFGFAGGFLAPVIAASGGDDHVVLFSYYALLNAAILAVAWFKSWRALNLLGFAFTFGIAAAWGVLRYAPSRLASTEPFLVLFFLFYVAITVLYALRQPPRLRGYIDATLLFGTPILAFAFQVELVRHVQYGIAWSALTLGAFYLLLAWWLPRLTGAGLKLLSQAFIALGVIFLSVAIPFAVAADTTAGVWALEGAGLVWIGARQGRPLARAFGLLLQAGAAVALAAGYPFPTTPQPFLNGGYLGAAMIGVAGAISAYWLDRADPNKAAWEQGGAPWLLIWGLAWWFGAGISELLRVDTRAAFPAHLLWYGLVTMLIAEAVASLLPWRRLRWVLAALPLVGLAALAVSLDHVGHPAVSGGQFAWPPFLALGYLVLFRIERREAHSSLTWSHAAMGLLLLAVLQWELLWRLFEQLGLIQGWRVAAVALVPLIGLALPTLSRIWPLSPWRLAYGALVGGLLALSLLLWALWSIESPGGAAPWPWLPLLNPVDTMLALVLLALWRWWAWLRASDLVGPTWDAGRLFWILWGSLAFLWINLALLRTLHHGGGIPYRLDALFDSDLVQMAVSVLWGLVGVGLLLVARARQSRRLWMVAALILAAVVLKLFAVDLAASGTLERIVSFLAVGGLLVGIGWLSPLPPRAEPEISAKPRPANRTQAGSHGGE